jgi:hypothetical protein
MAEFCGFVVDRKVPDEPCFVFTANGLCAGDLGNSASGCRRAQRFCHTDVA